MLKSNQFIIYQIIDKISIIKTKKLCLKYPRISNHHTSDFVLQTHFYYHFHVIFGVTPYQVKKKKRGKHPHYPHPHYLAPEL